MSEILTKEMCIEIIKNDKFNFSKIPDEYYDDYEFCLELAKLNPFLISHKFPSQNKTEELKLVAARHNYKTLSYVVGNEQICVEAIRNSPKAISLISKERQTPAIIDELAKAFLTESNRDSLLKYVQKKLQTEELCLNAIKSNPKEISQVHKKFLTKEFYDKAIAVGLPIEKVPEEFR